MIQAVDKTAYRPPTSTKKTKTTRWLFVLLAAALMLTTLTLTICIVGYAKVLSLEKALAEAQAHHDHRGAFGRAHSSGASSSEIDAVSSAIHQAQNSVSRRRRQSHAQTTSDVINVESDSTKTPRPSALNSRIHVLFPAQFKDIHWRLSDWCSSAGASLGFQDGAVVVKQAGIYFIYSQVTFYSLASRNDYKLQVNDVDWISCRSSHQVQVSLDSCDKYDGDRKKRCLDSLHLMNSCYAGALRHLAVGDKVTIKGRSGERKVIIGSSETFFGLMKM